MESRERHYERFWSEHLRRWIYRIIPVVLLAVVLAGCATQPTPDAVAKAVAIARTVGDAGCIALKSSIKETEAAQVIAAINVVKLAVNACVDASCSADALGMNLKALTQDRAVKFVPLIASVVLAAEVLIPPDVAQNAYVAVAVAAIDGCQAGLS